MKRICCLFLALAACGTAPEIDSTEQAICPPEGCATDYTGSWIGTYVGRGNYVIPAFVPSQWSTMHDQNAYSAAVARISTNVLKTRIGWQFPQSGYGIVVNTDSPTTGTPDNYLSDYQHSPAFIYDYNPSLSCQLSNFYISTWGAATKTVVTTGCPANSTKKRISISAQGSAQTGSGCLVPNTYVVVNAGWTFETACGGCSICYVNSPTCGIQYGQDCGSGCVPVAGQCDR